MNIYCNQLRKTLELETQKFKYTGNKFIDYDISKEYYINKFDVAVKLNYHEDNNGPATLFQINVKITPPNKKIIGIVYSAIEDRFGFEKKINGIPLNEIERYQGLPKEDIILLEDRIWHQIQRVKDSKSCCQSIFKDKQYYFLGTSGELISVKVTQFILNKLDTYQEPEKKFKIKIRGEVINDNVIESIQKLLQNPKFFPKFYKIDIASK